MGRHAERIRELIAGEHLEEVSTGTKWVIARRPQYRGPDGIESNYELQPLGGGKAKHPHELAGVLLMRTHDQVVYKPGVLPYKI